MSSANLIDLTGRTFGALTVTGRAPSRQAPSGSWQTYWRTRCECDAEGEVGSQNLRRGVVRSCGQAGCRGRYPKPKPVEVLADQHVAATVGAVAAPLRASFDHAAVCHVVLGLYESDDLVYLRHSLHVGTVALCTAASGADRAHCVVDSLAVVDRRATR